MEGCYSSCDKGSNENRFLSSHVCTPKKSHDVTDGYKLKLYI